MKLYGISNCNTVKKARDWLAKRDVAVDFHDFSRSGLDAETAQTWLQQADWTTLLNRRGLTWRGLSEQRKRAIQNPEAALALMLEKTSVIRRPILELDGKLLHVGFGETEYSKIINGKP